MKVRALLNIMLTLGAAGASVFAVPLTVPPAIPLFNTGTSGSAAGCIGTSTLTAGCTVATHGSTSFAGWTITSAPPAGTTNAEAITSAGGAPIGGTNPWLGDNTTSTWLSPFGSPDVAGDYRYQLQFNLTPAQAASSAIITGQWASDDQATLLLNGKTVVEGGAILKGVSSFTNWTPFQIDSGFVAGLNTLEIQVRNLTTQTTPGFAGAKTSSGVRLEFGSVFVPEGGEVTGMTLGLGLVLAAWKRKKAASASAQ